MKRLWRVNAAMFMVQLLVAAFFIYHRQWLIAAVGATIVPFFSTLVSARTGQNDVVDAISRTTLKATFGFTIALGCWFFVTGPYWPFGQAGFMEYLAMMIVALSCFVIGILMAFRDAKEAGDDVFFPDQEECEYSRGALTWAAMPVVGVFSGAASLFVNKIQHLRNRGVEMMGQ